MKCRKCGVEFRLADASLFDPYDYCSVCIRNLQAKEKRVTEIYENSEAEPISIRKYPKKIWIEGEDFLLLQHRANELTDEERLAHIEYHREMTTLLLKIDRDLLVERRNAQVAKQQKAAAQSASVTQTTVNQTKTTPLSKAPKTQTQNMVDLLNMLRSLNPADLASLGKK